MKNYENYINTIRCIFKNFPNSNEFNNTIKDILNKIFDTYFLERNIQLYNIDNLFKNIILICIIYYPKKYIMTNSKRLMFIKHRYNKKEYIYEFIKKDYIER